MGISVTALRNKLTGGGARPSLFFSTVEFPVALREKIDGLNGNEKDISFFMTQASIPASTLDPLTIPFLGRQMKVPSIDRTFQPFNTRIINDEDYRIRHFFESWIEIMSPGQAIFDAASSFGSNVEGGDNEVFGQLEVHQMTKDGQVTGKKEKLAGQENKFLGSYYFIDAFPTSVGEIALSWESGGEIEYFEVTFEYQYWVKKPGADATNDDPFKDAAQAANWVENPSDS